MTVSAPTPVATRSYSTRELQAAAAALAAGSFSTPSTRARTPSVELDQPLDEVSFPSAAQEPAVAPAHGDTCDGPPPTAAPVTGLEPLVRVRAANAGAGASTIALALADAADAAGIRTRVLDAAAPGWSGLLGATATELGAAEGWRRGRRGTRLLIDRVEDRVPAPDSVPAPRTIAGIDLTVLDAGWSMRELAAATESGTWLASPARAEVIITRPHGLALSQTEAALADLEEQLAAGQVVVVIVGANRWNDREFATAGPRLWEARHQGAVLFAPLLTAKVLPWLGPAPLPKQLTNPSQRLLERITNITGPLTSGRVIRGPEMTERRRHR